MGRRPNARGGGTGKSQESDINLTWLGILSSAIDQLRELGQLTNLFEPRCHHLKNKDAIIYPGKSPPCFHQAAAPAALHQGPGFAGTFSWSPYHNPERQGLLLTLLCTRGNRSSERGVPQRPRVRARISNLSSDSRV